jgi:predicted nucleic acid-binding Zn finger protein
MTQEQLVENKDPREAKGRVIATQRQVFRIIESDVFYVESQETEGLVYYVMFDTAKDFNWCSCPDFSRQTVKKCKHIWAVEHAIRKGMVKDTDKLPTTVKRDNTTKSAWTDQYDF